MRRIIFYLATVAMFSCSNRTAIPNDVLPMDSMRVILREVVAADVYLDEFIVKDTTTKDKVKAGQDMLQSIFDLHHLSRTEFKKSLDFYESRPDLSKQMFDSLAAYFNKHKSDMFIPKAARTPIK